MILCNNCGTENPDYARFCQECGKSVEFQLEAEPLKENIIKQFIDNLTSGQFNIKSSTLSPIILRKNESTTIMLEDISLLEDQENKKIDQGTLVLTNKRLIFIGPKKTVNIDLKNITSIETHQDGIVTYKNNIHEKEYFKGTNKTTLTFNSDGENITIPINGAVLKAMIMGNINKIS